MDWLIFMFLIGCHSGCRMVIDFGGCRSVISVGILSSIFEFQTRYAFYVWKMLLTLFVNTHCSTVFVFISICCGV